MNEQNEFIEQHEVKVVLAGDEEPVSAVATVTWEAPAKSDYITLPA